MSQSPCGARCANPRAVHGVPIPVRLLTNTLKKTKGPFAAGEHPGEADFHVVTWLARTISNAGVSPNSPSSVTIPKLNERTGGDSYDPVIARYWDAWIVRTSFKESNLD
ncbi:hypothetical protein EHS25_007193 [Saitozyma podzolica]|uniref:GST C-terminal domain-containing protein n=1 Tax=Saitozyma podzolica TaxID=1890683 RepID=A0A427XMY1_9TREE|nr:hypothetical protein EHS25_007193 [Saitozyma podzolica]